MNLNAKKRLRRYRNKIHGMIVKTGYCLLKWIRGLRSAYHSMNGHTMVRGGTKHMRKTNPSEKGLAVTVAAAALCGVALMIFGASFGRANQSAAEGMADNSTDPARCTFPAESDCIQITDIAEISGEAPIEQPEALTDEPPLISEEIEDDIILPQEYSTEKPNTLTTSAAPDAEIHPETEKQTETVSVTEASPSADAMPETEPPESLAAEEPKDSPLYLYDQSVLPLTGEQQIIANRIANEYGLRVELLYGIMYTESRYRVNIKSADGSNVGVMQINKCNFEMLSNALGVEDFMDYESNVRCGAYILSLLTSRYADNAKLLMCYNRGEAGAQAQWAVGNTYDAYCKSVLTEYERLLSAKNP